MADARIRDLADFSAAQLQAQFAATKLAVDGAALSDAEAMLLTTFCSSGAVPETSPPRHLIMTQAGFNASKASEAIHGVTRLADDPDIDERGDTNPLRVLTAGKMDELADALTKNIATITMSNIATYLTAPSNFTISNLEIHVKQIGKIVYMHGVISGTAIGSFAHVIFTFGQLPIPIAGTQAFNVSVRKTTIPSPVGSYVLKTSSTAFKIYAGATDLSSGSPIFMFGGSYIID